LFGQGEGAFGFGAVGQEAAGLPAHPPLRHGQLPLGEGGLERVAVDAELLGELEGAFGLGPVDQEPAGLPAHPPLGLQGPMVAAGDRSTSVRRWVDA